MCTLAGPQKNHALVKTILMMLVLFNASFVFAAPGLIGFQAHIYKPDNTPLQASSVNFRFTITDPVGTCVIYSEDFVNQNMSNSAGVVALSIGGGAKSYPAGPLTMYEVFNNLGQSFTCQSGGTYNSGSAERRRLIVQFNDGAGWQTLPAIDMNSVPFALQAMSAQKLDTYSASDFLRPATLPTCNPATQALTFNGTSFTCVATSSTSGTVTNVTASGSYLSVATSSTTPVISVNIGTTAGTLVAGNDSRITGALQAANNLSELTNAATARTNLGLGSAAVLSVGTASGQIPVLNAAGKLSSGVIPGTVMQTSDAAGGDLTGSYPGPTVATVGTKTASQIASTVDAVTAATSSNTSGQIVKRDSSGNFTAGSITATSFSGTNLVGRNLQLNDSGNNAITIQTINSGVTPYTIVLPASVGTSDQVVGWNAAANAWEYKTISAGSGVTINHSAGGIQINATGTGGTVTNVSSTNGYISVATSSTTPAITANVGTTSGTLAAGNDSRFTDARIPTGAAGGDLSGSFPNPILTNTGVTSGANYTKVTVDSKGRVTAAGSIDSSDISTALGFSPLANSLNSGLIFVGNASNVATAVALSGDATLDNTGVLTLVNSGVSAGTYTKVQVDTKGRVIASSSLTSADIAATGYVGSQWTTSGANISYQSGNVGIGTTASSHALEVSGDVNVTGVFRVNGTPISTGGGIVQTVTATASTPITIGGTGTNPTVGITQATGSAAGYLSSNDWNTFNSKLSSIVSSALNSGLMWVGNGSNQAAAVAMSGDARIDSSGNVTLQNAAVTRTNLGLGTAAAMNVNGVGNALSTEVVQGNDSRLIDARIPTGSAGGDLSGTYPNPILADSGVTSGANYTKVTVDSKGRVTAAGNITSADIIALGFATSASATQWTTSGSIIHYSTGNVGIGSSMPGAYSWGNLASAARAVEIAGDGSASINTAGVLALVNNRATATSSDGIGTIHFISRANTGMPGATINSTLEGVGGGSGYGGNLIFSTRQDGLFAASERLRITGTGRLGVGTSTPTANLQVTGQVANLPATSGTTTTGLAFRLQPSASVLALDFGGAGGSGSWIQSTNSTNLATNYPLLLNPNGGNVGVGTTNPQGRLHIADSSAASTPLFERSGQTVEGRWVTARFLATKTSDMTDGMGSAITFNIQDNAGVINMIGAIGAERAGADNTGDLVFESVVAGSRNERMRIMSGGNIGIGTATAAYKLDVSGDVNVTGNFKVNGANINSGTVTQVTGTLPISVATSTTTPVISIANATSSATGALTSSDWVTFNSKLSSTLNSALMWVGDGSNVATAVAISGDGRLDNAGNLTLQNAAITRTNLGLGLAAVYNVNLVGNASSTEVVFGTDTRLVDSRAPAGAAGGDLSGTYPNPILANSGVSAGTYSKVEVDVKGRVISASNLTSADIAATGFAASQWTTSGSNIYYSAGSVGIGLTNPTSILHVQPASSSSSGKSITLAAQSATGFSATGGSVTISAGASSQSTAGDINFNTSIGQSVYGNFNFTGGILNFAGNPSVAGSAFNFIDVKNLAPASVDQGSTMAFSANRTTGGMTKAGEVGGILTDITNGGYKGALVFSTANNTTPSERMRIDYQGNVGIGTTTPNRLLEVSGPIRVAASALPSSAAAGDIAIDSGENNRMKIYDGNQWQSAGDFGGTVDITGTTYTVLATQNGFALTFNGSAAATITLPALSAVINGFQVTIIRQVAQALTVTASGADTFPNASTSVELQGANIASATFMKLGSKWNITRQTSDCVLGQQCWAANMHFIGAANGHQIFTTPGGCTNSATPTCAGGAESVTFAWATTAPESNTLQGATDFNSGKAQSATLAALATTQAAQYCENMTYAGYSDWYLPSGSELLMIHQARPYGLSGFTNSGGYWSSTELTATQAMDFNARVGTTGTTAKTSTASVRCVRRF